MNRTDDLIVSMTDDDVQIPALQGKPLVDATWEELGFTLRPVGERVFVRTDLPRRKIGSLWLPPEMWGMYGKRLGSKETVTATILACGPLVKDAETLQPGEKVCFFRLPFGWTYKLKDGSFVGWIDADEIVGLTTEEDVQPFNPTGD